MAVYFIVSYVTLSFGEKAAAFLYPEDHFLENLQAICLFATAGISFYIFYRAYQNRNIIKITWIKLLVYLGLALIYFFIAGEEISWGQRIFHIATPASWAAQNTQGETNLHNLAIFEKGKIKMDNIFTVFWLGFTVAIPGGALLWDRFKQFADRLTPIVYWGFGILFLLNFVLAKVGNFLYSSGYTYQAVPFAQAITQVKEGNYDWSLLFLTLIILWELNKNITEKTKA
jgi:hypothetical protein